LVFIARHPKLVVLIADHFSCWMVFL